MATKGRAPVPFFGGKSSLAPRIVALFPPHEVYVEPFLGSGACFFSKPQAPLSILNDTDGALVNFFRVLRDPAKGARLREALDLTLYAREEWAECRIGMKAVERGWDSAADDVELARRWFVLTQQSFAGRLAGGDAQHRMPGWRFTTQAHGHNPAASFRSATARLADFTAALATAQIEHDDALAVMRRYDSKRALMYLDPPYLPDTRRGGGYGHEMTLDDHVRLLDALTAPTLRSMIVLSGYDSALYRERLEGQHGWQRLEVTVLCSAAGRTRASGLQGDGSVTRAQQTRTEILWLNPAAQRRQGLWAGLDAEPGAGDESLATPDDDADDPTPIATPKPRSTRTTPRTTRRKPSTRKGTATR